MPEQVEERLTLLEAEVELLKHQVHKDRTALPCGEKIVRTFSENDSCEEAMKLGRKYRNSH